MPKDTVTAAPRCMRLRSFFSELEESAICFLCKRTVGEHAIGRPAPDPANARIASILQKVADRIRAKSDETLVHDIADALEDEARELTR